MALGVGGMEVRVVVGGVWGWSNKPKPSSQRSPPRFAAIFSSGAAEAGVPSASALSLVGQMFKY